MIRAALLTAAILLAGCSHEDADQTQRDAKKLGQDLKQDVKKADEVLTKKMNEARDKVQERAKEMKKKADEDDRKK